MGNCRNKKLFLFFQGHFVTFAFLRIFRNRFPHCHTPCLPFITALLQTRVPFSYLSKEYFLSDNTTKTCRRAGGSLLGEASLPAAVRAPEGQARAQWRDPLGSFLSWYPQAFRLASHKGPARARPSGEQGQHAFVTQLHSTCGWRIATAIISPPVRYVSLGTLQGRSGQ